MDASTASLEDLIAKLFIARTDVKAYQAGPGPYVGQYFTDIQGDRKAENPVYIPWSRKAIVDHLEKKATYGHYLLSKNNECKLFAFDIDIDQQVELPHVPVPEDSTGMEVWEQSFCFTDGCAAWAQRSHPARWYMKTAMRSLAHVLERHIEEIMDIPTAVTYTGSKGLHVYGFTGLMPAKEVREGAMLVIESLPIKPLRGKMIYGWEPDLAAPSQKFPEHKMFTIEVFPKQDEIGPTGFGNLMRLPLGRNQKSPDPTFFVDTVNQPLGALVPTDPVAKLRSIWERIQG